MARWVACRMLSEVISATEAVATANVIEGSTVSRAKRFSRLAGVSFFESSNPGR